MASPYEILDGRFVLIGRAASGGMGTVYKAKDLATGRYAAVKVTRTCGDVEAARCRREAELLAAMDCPSIVAHIRSGRTPRGYRYLATEWLEGVTLLDKLAMSGLSVRGTLDVCLSVAEGLAYAHALGIVHRDVKPSNIFLPDGDIHRAKLLDFGIARRICETSELTARGVMLGTPSYMAPEQARGGAVTARVDVWALGCICYEALAGRPAFVGNSPMSTRLKVLHSEPIHLAELNPELPHALTDAIHSLMAKDLGCRPADAGEVVRTLKAIADTHDDELGRLTIRRVCAGAFLRDTSTSGRCQVTRPRRRLHSVVLMTGGADDDGARSVIVAQLRRVLDDCTGDYQLIDGQSVSCRLSSIRPRECAKRAVRLALALQKQSPDASIAVASTWESHNRWWQPVDALLEWCAERIEMSQFDKAVAGRTSEASAIPTAKTAKGATAARGIEVDSLTAELVRGCAAMRTSCGRRFVHE